MELKQYACTEDEEITGEGPGAERWQGEGSFYMGQQHNILEVIEQASSSLGLGLGCMVTLCAKKVTCTLTFARSLLDLCHVVEWGQVGPCTKLGIQFKACGAFG